MTSPPVALLTDFGLQDPFAGIMKGIILGICPNARPVDLTHAIRPQDIRHGAFALDRSVDFFPKGTVFCAVVDPGVGTTRRALAIRTGSFFFTGPDNGLLWPAASRCGIITCVRIENPAFMRPQVSATFHGRDIFAPAAAHLAAGVPIQDLGPQITDPVRLELPKPQAKGKDLILTILDQDIFGNLTLNISPEEFHTAVRDHFALRANAHAITQVCPTYAQAPDQVPFLLAGSAGLMEIAVKNGSAARLLDAGVGDTLVLSSTSRVLDTEVPWE